MIRINKLFDQVSDFDIADNLEDVLSKCKDVIILVEGQLLLTALG